MNTKVTANSATPSKLRAEKAVEPVPTIPAAQYVRMSDEAQQYSIDNQKAAIQEYAARHGFSIVKTYADLGKSGVVAKNRTALRELLRDVVSGTATYKAVLVYDVSRWGRFPNNDEAAHYEFLCSSAGIPLHYCAEQFANDGTASSTLLKALKRSMAAEFSRELGDKVFRGKSRIVQLGFWVGGCPGYGFRRLMLSATGKKKGMMKPGEQKSFTTDRVTLIPGPQEEVAGARLLFSLAAKGNGPTAIARELNRRGITHNGRQWAHQAVLDILRNPKYKGCNTWNKCTQRLRGPVKDQNPQFWVTRPKAFEAIVSEELFQRAQDNIPKPKLWSNEEILRKIRRLLKTKGRLSETLLLKARNMPCPSTLHKRLGTYRQIYEKLGYKLDPQADFMSMQNIRSKHLRNSIISKLNESFPEHIAVKQNSRAGRVTLLIDNSFTVSILFARPKQRRGVAPYWEVEPISAESDLITLLCLLNKKHDGTLGYYLFPKVNMWKSHRLRKNDWALRSAIKLKSLSQFYAAANWLWHERTTKRTKT